LKSKADAPADQQHWALLMAGSNTWGNYRHQADVYHAYQIFKAAGLDDEHIIMFHSDDIAGNTENPTPGQVINNPNGTDVYAGVPKDYTGADTNAANFLAALSGNTTSTGGKTLASGANDKVFVAFFDHGGPGILGVPEGTGPYIYANDVNDALKAKAAAGGFSELVFYIEACESGSIFDGLLPTDINVYATTAANPTESSWGYYCPGMTPAPPSDFNTCLGDLYAISWMENVDAVDTNTETLNDQYKLVKDRVSQQGTYSQGSHVMQYGTVDGTIDGEVVDEFIGNGKTATKKSVSAAPASVAGGAVAQRDADLHSMYYQYLNAEEGSEKKAKAFKAFTDETNLRSAMDAAADKLAKALLTPEELAYVRPEGEAVTTNWSCYKESVAAFETAFGQPLGQYGLKHAGILAKACNAGKTAAHVTAAL